jgi:hypothetical protein
LPHSGRSPDEVAYRPTYNPAMPQTPVIVAQNRSLSRLAAATRGELVRIATDLCEVYWIREALIRATDRDVRIWGRFDIKGPDGKTPWPAVLIEVRRRPQHSGQSDRRGIVAVYVNSDGSWEVSERESDKVPWPQYRGDRDGKPSVLNGDAPDEAPEPVIPQP